MGYLVYSRFYNRNISIFNPIFIFSLELFKKLCIIEPIAKVVIPVQTGIQKFLQHIEKTGFPLSRE